MENLSYVQQYFICAVNQKGNIPILKGVNVSACFVIGEITELIARDYIIWDKDNKISVKKPLDDTLTYLKPMYETIAFQKSQDVVRIVDMYASNIHLPGNYRKSLDELLYPIGNSLVEFGYVSEMDKKIVQYKGVKYTPKQETVKQMVEEICMVLLNNNDISDKMLCLVALLDKSDMLENHFNPEELGLLKERMREERKKERHDSIIKLLEYIDRVTHIISGLNWG